MHRAAQPGIHHAHALRPQVFQLTYQGKNLTTALFTYHMLGVTFSKQQMLALCILSAGVAVVQIDTNSAGGTHEGHEGKDQSHVLGVAAVLTACCTSGFAGVYFEKVSQCTATTVTVAESRDQPENDQNTIAINIYMHTLPRNRNM